MFWTHFLTKKRCRRLWDLSTTTTLLESDVGHPTHHALRRNDSLKMTLHMLDSVFRAVFFLETTLTDWGWFKGKSRFSRRRNPPIWTVVLQEAVTNWQTWMRSLVGHYIFVCKWVLQWCGDFCSIVYWLTRGQVSKQVRKPVFDVILIGHLLLLASCDQKVEIFFFENLLLVGNKKGPTDFHSDSDFWIVNTQKKRISEKISCRRIKEL